MEDSQGWEKASKYRRKYGFTSNKNLRAIQFRGNSFFDMPNKTTFAAALRSRTYES